MTETRWTTLPADIALQCPPWASDATKALAAESAEAFDACRSARLEVGRLQEAAQQIDILATNVCDLIGAGGMARQAMIEAMRDELLARSRFAEFLVMLESDRARVERESADAVNQAKQDAKAALLSIGCPDLSEAVANRGAALSPDHDSRAAFDRIISSFQPVVEAGTLHRECKGMGNSLTERAQYNRRHQAETEAGLRKTLSELASLAVA